MLMLAQSPIPLTRRATPASAACTETRPDGRTPSDIRPIKIRTGVVSSASGSAIIEMAHTKVLCSVFGPHATDGRDYSEQGQLDCSLRFASFARRRGRGRQPHGGTAEEKTLSRTMSAALSASVQLHLLPKSTIAVHALVLQDDGGALPAAITCASLALADASVALYDYVTACSCALLRSPKNASGAPITPHLDATADELSGGGGGQLLVACMPRLSQLTLLRQEGKAPFEEVSHAIELALSGCNLLRKQLAAHMGADETGGGGRAANGAEGVEENGDDEEARPRAKQPRTGGS